ncbi:MAG TPA: cytochrome b [Rhodanobacteraceae bacterium]|nr:cytochrome b [Rhodanobacteraceae bacterium]
MRLTSDARHWGSLAKLFHWLIVLAILAQGTIGLVMVNLPRRPGIIPVYSFHKSLGLTILALAVLRLVWRAFDRRPAQPPGMPHWQVIAARASHVLLYVLLFAVPLSGWLFDSTASLRPLYWWGLIRMPSLTGGAVPAWKDAAAELHEILFWSLFSLAALHAAAALKHHFIDRDDVLRRMLPRRRATDTSPD